MITKVSSREFNQHTSQAKAATRNGPVFITDHGRTRHVLLSYEEFERLQGMRPKIAELLALEGSDGFELAHLTDKEFPRAAAPFAPGPSPGLTSSARSISGRRVVQRIPDPIEAKVGKMSDISRCKLVYAMMAKCEGQPGIEDRPTGGARPRRSLPDRFHQTAWIIDDAPGGIRPESLAGFDGIQGRERMCHYGWVA